MYSGVPDAPSSVSVRYKSSASVSLDVEPPANDGGLYIIGYRVDYHGRVQEFQTGMLTQASRSACYSK